MRVIYSKFLSTSHQTVLVHSCSSSECLRSYYMEMLDPSVWLCISLSVRLNKISQKGLVVCTLHFVLVLLESTSKSSSKFGLIGQVGKGPVIRVRVRTDRQTDRVGVCPGRL